MWSYFIILTVYLLFVGCALVYFFSSFMYLVFLFCSHFLIHSFFIFKPKNTFVLWNGIVSFLTVYPCLWQLLILDTIRLFLFIFAHCLYFQAFSLLSDFFSFGSSDYVHLFQVLYFMCVYYLNQTLQTLHAGF